MSTEPEKLSGAETLRRAAKWIDWQNETFLDRFTAEELLALWAYGRAHDREVAEFADSWTEAEIRAALAPLRRRRRRAAAEAT